MIRVGQRPVPDLAEAVDEREAGGSEVEILHVEDLEARIDQGRIEGRRRRWVPVGQPPPEWICVEASVRIGVDVEFELPNVVSGDRKSTRLNSVTPISRMPSSAWKKKV